MELNAGLDLPESRSIYVSYHLRSARDFITNRLFLWVFVCYNFGGDIMFERLLKLITEKDLEEIANTSILLVGVGGVGGYVLESLVRSGFKNFLIVDGDLINLSNLNRQIVSKMDNLDTSKVVEAKKRMESINPDVNIEYIDTFLTNDNFDNLINKKYDYIIDACDDIPIKLKIIEYASKDNIPIIVALGTGRKLNPSLLEVTTLNKTFNDPLARKLRYELRKKDISLNIPVVFSKEEAIKTDDMVGSAIFVPASAGILIAYKVFLDIIKKDY